MTFIAKEDTHTVVKNTDVVAYLSVTEHSTLAGLLHKIQNGRLRDHKKINSYYLCNVDEDYSGEILEVIRKHEGGE